MIEITYIIIFSMAIINVIKKRIPNSWNDLIPFMAFLLAIGFNILNAWIFGGDILQAGKDAFIAAGVSLALFTGGSAVGKNLLPSKTSDSNAP